MKRPHMKTYLGLTLFLLVLLGCNPMPPSTNQELQFNDNIPDESPFKIKEIDAALSVTTDPFLRAKIIMRETCFRCHGEWTNYNEQTFIQTGLIYPGSPDSSSIIIRSKFSKAFGVGPMPLVGSPEDKIYQLRYHEYLKAWVAGAKRVVVPPEVELIYGGVNNDASSPLSISGIKGELSTTAQTFEVLIKNNSTKSLALTGAKITGVGFLLSGSVPLYVASKGTSKILFSLNHSSAGAKSSQFEVSTSSPLFPKIFINFSGLVTTTAPNPIDVALSGQVDSFSRAKVVMQNACFRCHSDWSNFTEQQFIDQGLVKAGDPVNSLLIKRSMYSGSGMTPMPSTGSPESQIYKVNHHEVIKTWITSLKDINAGTKLDLLFNGLTVPAQAVVEVKIPKVLKDSLNAVMNIKLKNSGTNTVNLTGTTFTSTQLKFLGLGKSTLLPGEMVDLNFSINTLNIGIYSSPFELNTNLTILPKISLNLTAEVYANPISELDLKIQNEPTAFGKTKLILAATCNRCHAAWGAYSEQDFIDNGIIAAGSPLTSKLLIRSKFTTGGNMPPATSPEASVYKIDYHNYIKSWITLVTDKNIGSLQLTYLAKNYDPTKELAVSGILGTTEGVLPFVSVKIKNTGTKTITFGTPSMSSTQFTFVALSKTKLLPAEEALITFKIDQSSMGVKAARFELPTDLTTIPKIVISLSGEIKSLLTAMSFNCDSTNSISAFPVRKLTKSEIIESIKVLFGSLSSSLLLSSESAIATIPQEDNSLKFPSMDKKVTKQHTDSYYYLGRDIAKAISNSKAMLSTIVGTCSTAAPVLETCYTGFITTFGQKVFRRPLTTDEVNQLKSLYQGSASSPEGFGAVINALLTSPNFTNEIIHGETSVTGQSGVYVLSPWELTSKIYFTVVGHTPDDFGLSKAQDKSIMTVAGVNSLLDYLYTLKNENGELKANKSILTFMSKWLDFSKLSSFNSNSSALKNLAGTDLAPPQYGTHYDDGVRSLNLYLNHMIFETNGSLSDLLTSNKVFAVSDTLKNIFKVPAKSEAFQLTSPTEARGLLLHPLFLYGGRSVAENDPFPRGSKLAKNILCKEIKFPTDLDTGSLSMPEYNPAQTTRERFEGKTSADACLACHKVLNPMGFALEGFDVLGRYSSVQKIYSPTNLSLVNTLNINDQVTLEIIPGLMMDVQGGYPFVQAIENSKVAHACMAKHFLEYTSGTIPQGPQYCSLKSVYTHLVENRPVKDIFRALVNEDSFKKVKRVP